MSTPSSQTARTHERWLSPTWSASTRSGSTPSSSAAVRWTLMFTLHSPTARCPSSSSARVTIPTGFVKSTIHASGAATSRARSAIASTTGTVRRAFANPPAPVVSCPMQPHSSGTVSSSSRAAWPPTRIWIRTESAPSSARERSSVSTSVPSNPWRESIRRASPATTPSRSRSMSCSASSSTGSRSRSRESPDTNSGV